MPLFKKKYLIAFLIILPLILQADIDLTISKIVYEIDVYQNKPVNMTLKLKQVDRIFEKIIFYDSENIDIEFDVSGKEAKKRLRNDMLNLHEGMAYRVSFIVTGTGNLGGLIGILESFTPLFLDKIP
ncbi:MAG: hypothetical protein WDA74_08730 [Spirochaetota bacterium]